MKRKLFAAFLLLTAPNLFCYEYKSDAFEISGGHVKSFTDSNYASVSGNTLNSEYQGKRFSRTLRSASVPSVSMNDSLLDFLTKMAAEEISDNITAGGFFAAGAKWPTAWTRDMSYAIDLSLSFLFPDAVEKSLATRVADGVILQDTGTGGSYPVSTDRIVWGRAAYAYALVKQDDAYFRYLYEVLSNTLKNDYAVIYDYEKKLFRGEQSFLDWREQTYPRWMDSVYIGNSYALGTNIVFHSVLCITARLADRFGDTENAALWESRAGELRDGIIANFWIKEKKYFGAYMIEHVYPFLYEGYETLGESLAVIDGLVPGNCGRNVLNAVTPGKWGMPVVAPQLANVVPYHNDAVWPFVQGYRGLAAKKAGDVEICEHEFASMIYAASMFQTFKENYVSSSCDMYKTATNSDRQLWSVAAWLSFVYKVVCGLDFTEEGLSIQPLVFDSLKDGIELKGLNFNNSVLNMKISGTGGTISSFIVNGVKVPSDYIIPYGAAEKYDVEIVMKKSHQETAEEYTAYFAGAEVTPQIPVTSISVEKNKAFIEWRQKNSEGYSLYKNGVFLRNLSERELKVSAAPEVDIYSVFSVKGDIPVLPGAPMRFETKKNTWFMEAEEAEIQGGVIAEEEGTALETSEELERTLCNGGRYVEKWGSSLEDKITFTFNAKKSGLYLIDFRFRNGHGPINTGEKCAVRTLSVDGKYLRRLPFPQLGSWSVWNFTAPVQVQLEKGVHSVTLSLDEFCYTQRHLLNYISLDMMRVSKIK